jgi:hypothetical protein
MLPKSRISAMPIGPRDAAQLVARTSSRIAAARAGEVGLERAQEAFDPLAREVELRVVQRVHRDDPAHAAGRERGDAQRHRSAHRVPDEHDVREIERGDQPGDIVAVGRDRPDRPLRAGLAVAREIEGDGAKAP